MTTRMLLTSNPPVAEIRNRELNEIPLLEVRHDAPELLEIHHPLPAGTGRFLPPEEEHGIRDLGKLVLCAGARIPRFRIR